MARLHISAATVIERTQISSRLWRLVVRGDKGARTALLYADLVGEAHVGDEVLINTTAVDLNLGTGGVDFVVHTIGRPTPANDVSAADGHMMKLRYTPYQLRVLAVEEEASPFHERMTDAVDVGGMPAIVLTLHSQLAPAAAGVRIAFGQKARIVFVMTDAAALPMQFSDAVRRLRAASILNGTVTTGDAFGGDVEAMTLFSGVLAARHVLDADVALVGPGPGMAGTGTTFGTTAVSVGQVVDAVSILRGIPLVPPRLSFADDRPRHYGISHHTLTALGRVAQRRCALVLPRLPRDKGEFVERQLREASILDRHKAITEDRGQDAFFALQAANIPLRSMGRDEQQERWLFLAAAGAGYAAADGVDLRE